MLSADRLSAPDLYEPTAKDAITHAANILKFTKSAIDTKVLTKKPQQSSIVKR